MSSDIIGARKARLSRNLGRRGRRAVLPCSPPAASLQDVLRRPRTRRSARSASAFRKQTSSTCAGAFRRRGGPSGRPSRTSRRACSWRSSSRSCSYWGTDYDWRKAEAKLNALPQFVTEIDGLDIQFIHVRSRHPNAMPLIMTHGWPGSPLELLKVIGPLTDPTAHGGRAEDAFHLVLPTYPGYGFSGKPTGHGLGPRPRRARMARADAAPGLHALRVAGRRLGRDHLAGDGGAGAGRAARHPHQHARHRAAERPEAHPQPRAGALPASPTQRRWRSPGSRTSTARASAMPR